MSAEAKYATALQLLAAARSAVAAASQVERTQAAALQVAVGNFGPHAPWVRQQRESWREAFGQLASCSKRQLRASEAVALALTEWEQEATARGAA